MANVTYDKQLAALLVVDPCNDFISEGGKIWRRIRAVAEANNCVQNMLQVLNPARNAQLQVVYALHRRYRPGDYETWKTIAPIQKRAGASKSFEYGAWGGELRPGFERQPREIVAAEHWCSSGFANTDLDLQLKKRWRPRTASTRSRPESKMRIGRTGMRSTSSASRPAGARRHDHRARQPARQWPSAPDAFLTARQSQP
jgi:hypothetical protein